MLKKETKESGVLPILNLKKIIKIGKKSKKKFLSEPMEVQDKSYSWL